jgi:voltage-gated potassium channel
MNRRRLYLILAPHSPGLPARIFRTAHHAVVAAGIAVMLAATVQSIHDAYESLLEVAFYAIAAFFLVEYVLRLYTAPERPGGEHYRELSARLTWAISLGGIFDLISAVPAILALAHDPTASLLGFIWGFKYVRFSPGLYSLGRVVNHARHALLSVLLGFAMVLLTAASVSYLLERNTQPEAFGSIPAALWWAIVTLTTTGYGDVVPQTIGGRLLAGVVMVCGILVFALWAGILATGYATELRRREFLRTWELVAKVPFFHNIGASLIAEVARLLRPRDYPEGSVIVRRGEPGDCMYFVVEGEVEIQLPDQGLYLGPGQFFGELALLTGAPRNASVVAATGCTLLVLDVVDFHELLARQPELARIIHEEARQRLRGTTAPPFAHPAAVPAPAPADPL